MPADQRYFRHAETHLEEAADGFVPQVMKAEIRHSRFNGVSTAQATNALRAWRNPDSSR
jgi:hypothetical protein